MKTPLSIRACFMRGGTSKGVFFTPDDLPAGALADPARRDELLMRVMGSPDPYGKQIDGMGCGSSSTSKVVFVSRSSRQDCDVDYLFGAVGIENPGIDWSGNCGNLTTAVGPFAIHRGLVKVPENGFAAIRIWQANIGKRIIATVPVSGGQPIENGDFLLDGVAFPAAEIGLEFLDPEGAGQGSAEALFPSGHAMDGLVVPSLGDFDVTLLNAGNPTVFVHANAFGLAGSELPDALNLDAGLLHRLETVRAHAAVLMGLAKNVQEATQARPGTPKIALVASPLGHASSRKVFLRQADTDILVRIVSMGRFHHAITGTGAVAVAVAAAVPGTLVHSLAGSRPSASVRIGHASGIMPVSSQTSTDPETGHFKVERVCLSRSARRLMDGHVFVS